jgi:hypothetical protein
MYNEEMQVMFEYWSCWSNPIIIEGVIAFALRKLIENEFPFIFSLMVKWIQMIYSIQMYHGEMQVKLDLENFLKMTASVHFLSDG